jgi:acyl-CoA synthetase (NDP forming)
MTESTFQKLKEVNVSGFVNIGSTFVDVTPMSDDNDYAGYIEAFLQDGTVDAVFVSVIPHVAILKTDPERARDEDSLGNHLVRLYQKYQKPMVISVNAGSYYSEFVSLMEENGLPVYDDIRSAVRSLDVFVSYYT